MIRYPFIYNQVLQIYRDMEQIRFPIEPDNIISRFSNCTAAVKDPLVTAGDWIIGYYQRGR